MEFSVSPSSSFDEYLAYTRLSGCDTVSSVFDFGKTKLAKVVAKNPELAMKLEIFLNPRATEEDLCTNGKEIVASLYIPPTKESLNFNALRPSVSLGEFSYA